MLSINGQGNKCCHLVQKFYPTFFGSGDGILNVQNNKIHEIMKVKSGIA